MKFEFIKDEEAWKVWAEHSGARENYPPDLFPCWVTMTQGNAPGEFYPEYLYPEDLERMARELGEVKR